MYEDKTTQTDVNLKPTWIEYSENDILRLYNKYIKPSLRGESSLPHPWLEPFEQINSEVHKKKKTRTDDENTKMDVLEY